MENEKNVVMTVDQYNSLLARIDTLEKEGKGVIKSKRVIEHVSFLREWEGRLFVGWSKNAYEIINERTQKEELKIELLLRDKDGKIIKKEADLLDFLNNAPIVKVKILDQKAKTMEKSYGSIFTSPSDPVSLRESGRKFNQVETDLVVTSVEYTSTVEVLEGNFTGVKLDINNRFLNN